MGKNLMSDDFLGKSEIRISDLKIGVHTYFLPIIDQKQEGTLTVEIQYDESEDNSEDSYTSNGTGSFVASYTNHFDFTANRSKNMQKINIFTPK